MPTKVRSPTDRMSGHNHCTTPFYTREEKKSESGRRRKKKRSISLCERGEEESLSTFPLESCLFYRSEDETRGRVLSSSPQPLIALVAVAGAVKKHSHATRSVVTSESSTSKFVEKSLQEVGDKAYL
ncbi:hypothetical protein AVEN_41900-1 [Araneus ventricosus]|uniref:Uncharacterized protein n=1 Tax=Araneus ventricosus TaxID=182803 RepID=A0A4Y2ACI2_ARAVE|nr:hypothetical protein AVEN_41900-1 [Araneus ventricosus]